MDCRPDITLTRRAAAAAVLLVAVAVALACFCPSALAARDDAPHEGRVMTVPEGEVIEGDWFATGSRVEMMGKVTGDLYAFAGEVTVGGEVEGDLLAAGGTVRVGGDVARDARVAGGEVSLKGSVGRNLTVAGGSVRIERGAAIEGNVVAAASELFILGSVGGSVRSATGALTLAGRVARGVEASTGNLTVASGAEVEGDVNYESSREATIEKGADLGGSVVRTSLTEGHLAPAEAAREFFTGAGFFARAMSLVSTLVLGLLLVRLAPGFSLSAGATITGRPWASLGLGLAVVVTTPVVVVALALTVLGLPLAVMVAALYVPLLYASRVFVMLRAGSLILSRGGHPGWAFFIGLVAYTVLTLVPFAGGLVTLATLLWGTGAFLIAARSLRAGLAPAGD